MRNRIVAIIDKIILICLYLLIFCLPFSRAMIEIATSVAFLAWCVKRYCLRDNAIPNTILNIPIAVFFWINLISVFSSIRPALSLGAFIFKILEYLIIYFLVTDTIRSRKRLKNLVAVAFISVGIIAIDGLIQYSTHTDFIRNRPWVNALRICATFDSANDLGGYLIIFLPIILSIIVKGIKNIMVKVTLIVEEIILISSLILTWSMGAMAGFLNSLIFVGLFKNRKTLLGIILLLLIIIVILPHYYTERVIKTIKFEGASVLDRKLAWHIGLTIIKDRPVFGHGLSTFMTDYERYNPIKNAPIIYAHNCYIQMAAETGIVGLLAFLWIVITLFWLCISSLKKIQDKFYRSLLLGLLSGILAFLIHSGVDTNLYSLPLVTLFWFMMGLAVAVRNLGFEDLKARNST